MKRSVFFILSFLILLSCEKEEQIDINLADGVYVGTFQREAVWFDNDTANITLTFTSNQWNGSSDMVKYPALCHGTYLIVGDTIIFENECAWIFEFDWSLILDGKYVLKKSGSTIEFSRDYRTSIADTYVDRYRISKQD